jgi:hypothetical protein
MAAADRSHPATQTDVPLVFLILLLCCAPAAGKAPAKKREPRGYTRAEVAQHMSEDDLWLILQNKDSNKFKVGVGTGRPKGPTMQTAQGDGAAAPTGACSYRRTRAPQLTSLASSLLPIRPACLHLPACLNLPACRCTTSPPT